MKNSYTIARWQAADLLWVSTRTIDRYVKWWKLSYKKIANKVLLNKDEVLAMKEDYDMLHMNPESTNEVVREVSTISPNTWISERGNQPKSSSWLDQMIDEKIERFFMVFKEKEKLIEDKNKIIFMLQQRVGELESKIQSMVALPDYNAEKQQALLEKKKLEQKLIEIQRTLSVEKTKWMISLWFLFVVIGLVVVFFLMWN